MLPHPAFVDNVALTTGSSGHSKANAQVFRAFRQAGVKPDVCELCASDPSTGGQGPQAAAGGEEDAGTK